ncbi:MAG: hypothetical protein HND52_14930 [Ignavibacteriae bacterium]|nr:hypothetical protein [Ignavibacteriota bacterium]NOG99248.1 hypothetical protein [Ignavibacteriota bacterium]
MVALKDDSGYSILETLVSITILGLIAGITVLMLNGILKNPKLLLIDEAINLVYNEINFSMSSKTLTDTSYFNRSGNIKVERKIIQSHKTSKIIVNAKFKGTNKLLVSMNTIVNNESD